MPKKLKTITFIQRKNKRTTYAEHHGQCDMIIENWKKVSTVRANKTHIFIKHVSFPYACEMLRNAKIPYIIKTEL